jgi:hypothetical protein
VPKLVRIANAGGYWGDDPHALRRQVLGKLPIDYVSADFLAEITMSILQKQFSRDPQAGYARDFITQVEPLLEEVLARKITIITNAGGVNPSACAEALFAAARSRGLTLKVAVIEGDDIAPRITELRKQGVDLKNMETDQELADYADRVLSANAYFGALPVVRALEFDPDVVLSGRVTDTGITLAALIHEFGWSSDDYDKLAHGILGGHIIECGAQATGGNFTDWCKVPSFFDIGFPILECDPDGSFVVTKHPESGGLVTRQTVREQLLYEMGHPQLYLTPDVVADFTSISLEQDGPDRVRVQGVRGTEPTDLLKVSVSLADGFKSSGSIIVSGPDARTKANVFAEIFWSRLSAELERAGLSSLESISTELVGDDSTHRGLTPSHRPTEILLQLSARDHNRGKLAIFRKLLPSLILSGPSGVAVTGGAPAVSDVVRYWPALIPQELALPSVTVYLQEGEAGQTTEPNKVAELRDLAWPETGGSGEVIDPPPDPYPRALIEQWDDAPRIEVPLMKIAHARSGDKGDTANIGLIGRSPECYVWLRENVTPERVRKWFESICRGEVHRYVVPNLWALNFLLDESLGGGGTVSLSIDPQGKTFSQAVLRCRVRVPTPLLETIEPEDAACPGELISRP